MNLENSIEKAQKVIKEANGLIITAGAGIGVDSGLPDFRGNEGFWKAYPAIAKLGINFTYMANPKWFEDNPKLAWAFYGHRLNLYRKTIPHGGFKELLKIANSKKGGYFIFTSNVDGQFQKAGFDENRVVECHGSIQHFQCKNNCHNEIWSAKDIEVSIDMETFEAKEPLPKCKECGVIARPNILMFGDWGWNSNRSDAQDLKLKNWLNLHKDFKLAIVEIGAGKAVPTVRYTSENIAQNFNATLIRINPRDFNVPTNHISIALGGEEGIKRII